MAKFVPGETLKTREARVRVDAGLPPGVHRFQLEVLTDTGQRSIADVVAVKVVRSGTLEPGRPVVITPVTPVIRRQR